jgi:Rad3-related DNA helicase
MDSFSDELRTTFGVQLENSHAIDKSQLSVNVVSCTMDKKPLNFVYKRRTDFDQSVQLGKFIKSVEVEIPGGILVFFASYEMMAFTMKTWDHQQVTFEREMFCETKGQKDFEVVFKKYIKRIHKGKRALLCCVCRGKLSEGIDFIDNAARAIFVVGIPYPCVNDPRVLQK